MPIFLSIVPLNMPIISGDCYEGFSFKSTKSDLYISVEVCHHCILYASL